MRPGEPFELDVEADGDAVVVRLAGEIDITAEEVLLDRIAEELRARPGTARLRLDLREVSFIDSSGLRSVLLCQQHAEHVGVPLVVSVVDGPVTRLFELSGVGAYFTYDPPR